MREPENLPFLTDEQRWAALLARDSKADGHFFYSVRTTGVYCRPSCAARTPRRENVAFHEDVNGAVAAGFRPCKRCRPEGPSRDEFHAKAVAAACLQIDACDQLPPLDALAAAAGMSRFHFHRVFKAITGMTPRGYAVARRAETARRELMQASSVSDAIYGARFNAASRFYAAAPSMLGMRPNSYRAGGAGEIIRFAAGECSLGHVLVAATDRGVCAILLGDDPELLARDLQDRFPRAELIGGDTTFEATVSVVVGMVERPGMEVSLPLDIRGTAFQERVWKVLSGIRPGEILSYAEVAQRLGEPSAARAVAQACGANRLAIAIPCHRVVRRDGSLSGYRWGIERKRELLARESRTA